MKRLPVVILLMVTALVAVVTGCRDEVRYDARLTAADSLLTTAPDSALALVETLTRDSLTTDGDRAYRDLLLTQARYKCYITATSDSDINRALAYYRAHSGEQEKLTRAYIYKGAVMEELGLPDSAMLYYKHAEATAASDDYFNLGYVNLKIAELYMDQLSQDSIAIQRLKESITYFGLINDTTYLISSLGSLGSFYGTIAPDSAIIYLDQAITLSKQYNPSLQYSHKSTLAGIYFYQNDFASAKELAIDILKNGVDYCNQTQFYYYAALSYIKMGYVDSAKSVLRIIPSPLDAVDSMNYYNTFAEIANAENNYEVYKEYNEQSHNLTERILSESQKGEIALAEGKFDKLQSEKHFKEKSSIAFKRTLILIVFFLIIIASLIFWGRQLLLKRANETRLIKSSLEDALFKLKEQANRNKTVSSLVSHRINALNELYQDIRVKINDESRVKRIIPLSSVLKSLNERQAIIKIRLNQKFWDEMILSVNGEYNGVYSFVEKHYPNLTDKELKIFCLLCANLSPQIIRLCMNFTSAKTVTNYRSIIVKKKMGLDMSFEDFLKKYVNDELPCGE